MKTLILILIFVSAACAPAETRVSFDKNGQPVYRAETASEKTKRLADAAAVAEASRMTQAADAAKTKAVRMALERLKKSAERNQDIADILTLLGY